MPTGPKAVNSSQTDPTKMMPSTSDETTIVSGKDISIQDNKKESIEWALAAPSGTEANIVEQKTIL